MKGSTAGVWWKFNIVSHGTVFKLSKLVIASKIIVEQKEVSKREKILQIGTDQIDQKNRSLLAG